MTHPQHHATRLLTTLAAGDSTAAEELMPLVYDELRQLAGAYFRGQPADHTLQPTALVHEAFLRLIDQTAAHYNDRAHFLAVAATAMRQILINHAAKRASLKRGGERLKLPLDEQLDQQLDAFGSHADADLLILNEALDELADLDPRKARVVEMRCFAGLEHQQIATVLGVSKRTVEGDWRMARAWLSDALDAGNSP